MEEKDIRWKQRFSNYQKALVQFEKFFEKEKLNELEEQGLIKSFEYTYELAWNVMKDFLKYSGKQNIIGSRDAIKESFKEGIIEDGENWMEMFNDRNKTAHTYNENTADEISSHIITSYRDLFIQFKDKMASFL